MPCADFGELVRGEIADVEFCFQLRRCEAVAEIAPETLLAMFTQAIVTIKIIDHESIQARADALTRPRLENSAPVGVVQACPVFLHATDGVAVVDARRAVSIFFQKIQRVFHRLGAELFFVPQFVVKFKETAWAILTRRFAHEKLDIEMADDEYVELV